MNWMGRTHRNRRSSSQLEIAARCWSRKISAVAFNFSWSSCFFSCLCADLKFTNLFLMTPFKNYFWLQPLCFARHPSFLKHRGHSTLKSMEICGRPCNSRLEFLNFLVVLLFRLSVLSQHFCYFCTVLLCGCFWGGNDCALGYLNCLLWHLFKIYLAHNAFMLQVSVCGFLNCCSLF